VVLVVLAVEALMVLLAALEHLDKAMLVEVVAQELFKALAVEAVLALRV
jgi:hypothetical protein